MNKAVFLDRDGTINVDYGYVYRIDDFKFIDGVIEGLKILNDLGYLLIIITNQSGIGRAFYSEKDFEILNNYMLNELEKNKIHISAVYHCPHVDKDNCSCRKPKLELFYRAIKDFDIDVSKSFAIGDKKRDLAICEKENITGILISNKNDKKYICKDNFLKAVQYIKKLSGSD